MPENEIDGKNVWDLISGKENAQNPQEYYALSTGRNFEGVMSGDGKWKLHVPHAYRTLRFAADDGQAGKYDQNEIELSLFDMENDPMESQNVIEDFPVVAEKLIQIAENHKNRFYTEK